MRRNGRPINRSVNEHDLPVVPCLFERHGDRASYLVGTAVRKSFVKCVITRSPGAAVPGLTTHIRDRQFLRRVALHQFAGEKRNGKYMAVFIGPDGIGRCDLLNVCPILFVNVTVAMTNTKIDLFITLLVGSLYNEEILQLNLPQPQRIRDDGYRTESHCRARNHRTQ